MSNSIWKTPDQKPENGQHILFFAGGGRLPYLGFYSQTFDIFKDWKSKDIQKWANVLDLISQADKAERLQKVLPDIIEYIDGKRDYFSAIGGDIERENNLIDEIKQLTKGE